MIILNYHELSEQPPSNKWCLTREAFDEHLALCRDRVISPERFLARCDTPAGSRGNDVLITFDDGFLSDYTLAYGQYVATGCIPGFMSFIPLDFVGQPGRMSWGMIEELSRAGITIGSHGLAHIDLTKASDAELERELTVSKSMLEERLGQHISLFAFPYGRFSRRVWEAALRAGYSRLHTIQLGHHGGFEPFLYSRLCMTSDFDVEQMRKHLADPDATRGMAWRISSKLGIYRHLMLLRYR
jgi:peptidoglycan/xylan/chitin deacetylase (PgdA/CDA1 family)